MIAQRIGSTALRRAATKPSTFFTHNVARAMLVSTQQQQIRSVTTDKISTPDADSLLAAQRLRRPVSPHLEIYDKQQTFFIGSIWQRFTGAGFAGLLYAYSAAYLAAPLLGWHLESASLAAAVAAWPLALKGGLKFLIAWPFAFHGLNGVRHLVQDLAIGFTKTEIKKGGWAVWGSSLVLGLGLAFLL